MFEPSTYQTISAPHVHLIGFPSCCIALALNPLIRDYVPNLLLKQFRRRRLSLLPLPPLLVYSTSREGRELTGSLNLGNVWVLVQLIFGHLWPMNQLNKNPYIAQLETSYQLWRGETFHRDDYCRGGVGFCVGDREKKQALEK